MTNQANQQHTSVSAMDLTVETSLVVSCAGLEVRATWLSQWAQGVAATCENHRHGKNQEIPRNDVLTGWKSRLALTLFARSRERKDLKDLLVRRGRRS